ncbi:MAG: hypothetical protein K8J08_09235 [Thermoanaerobaculia bacterium]|nr:hypothetical protein [Thermoanaerobaculia bacterium]
MYKSSPFPRIERLDPAMVAVWREKTGGQRLAIAAGMFRSARRMLENHLRNSHPSWDDTQLEVEIARRLGNGDGYGAG